MSVIKSFSNEAEVDAWLLGGVTSFGFHSPAGAGGKSLGEALVDNHVVQIRERSFVEQRGADGPWPKNDPKYLAEKEKDFGTDLVNVRTKEMLSEESVAGQATITDREVVHVYGTGRPGDSQPKDRPASHFLPSQRRGRKGGPSKAKTRPEPTDVAKAQWAEEQGRGFFELDEKIEDSNGEIVSDSLEYHLENR